MAVKQNNQVVPTHIDLESVNTKPGLIHYKFMSFNGKDVEVIVNHNLAKYLVSLTIQELQKQLSQAA